MHISGSGWAFRHCLNASNRMQHLASDMYMTPASDCRSCYTYLLAVPIRVWSHAHLQKVRLPETQLM